jgi:hypothetical protein
VKGEAICTLSPQNVDGVHLLTPTGATSGGGVTAQALEHPTLSEFVTLLAPTTVRLQCSKLGGAVSVNHAQLQAIQLGGVTDASQGF